MPVTADFSATAERLGYLSTENALRLRDESRSRTAPESQLAIQLGLLDAVQIDTVETLLRPRDAIPGYEILDVRGRGGMGVVYRARQTSLGRIVALKTLLISKLSDESFLARFQQEARTLAQLRHPNIVSIYDFGRAAGRVYIAMEFIDGTDVEGLVKQQGGLPERVAWGIARQVAAGLAHGARLGVVHRDIKPANLLLVDPPEGFPLPSGVPMVKIADFGLATLTEDSEMRTRLTTENATVGSPQYMAPEQFHASRVDLRADIYSLGATVYELLAGQPPFAGLQLSQIIGFKLSKGPPALSEHRPDITPATQALVERMMARDPAGRPADYTELLRAIDELSASAPATGGTRVWLDDPVDSSTRVGNDLQTRVALPPTPVEAATSSRRFGRPGWLVGGVTALAVTAVVALILIQAQRSRPPVRVPVTEGGSSEYLFNGVSMSGWTPVNGQWTVPPGDAVIEGTNGELGHELPRFAGDRPADCFRLVVVVELTDAESANVQFGYDLADALTEPKDPDGPRYVVQLTPEQVVLGERDGGSQSLQPLLPPRPMKIAPGAQHTVILERLPTGWFVSVDDTQIGAAPLRDHEAPLFRLAATGGAAARFSDIEFVPLRPLAQQ